MNRRILRSLVTAGALGLAAGTVWAAGPSYNHLGISVADIELDDNDIDGDGFRIDGAFLVHPNIYLLGQYANWDLDGSLDREDFRGGVGLRAPLQANADVIGELFYENREYDSGRGRDRDDDGLGLRAGVRAAAARRVELEGGAIFYDLDHDDEFGLYGRAWYEIVTPFLVGADLELTDEQTILGLNGRFRF